MKVALKDQTNSVIELQILKNNDTIFHSEIKNPSEISNNIQNFLKQFNIAVPHNRMDSVMKQLEGDYNDLLGYIKQQRNIQLARQQATTKVLSNSTSAVRSQITQKFLMMGLSSAGKSSIYQVLFKGKLPHETRLLAPTRGLDRYDIYNIQNMSSDKVNGTEFVLWELGGQTQFLDRYYQEPEKFFTQATCLIFIIDAFNVDRYEEARIHLHKAIKLMNQFGHRPVHLGKDQSNIFIFLHKMDEFPNREERFKSLCQFFSVDPETVSPIQNLNFYSTSIFDSSIYGAWTKLTRIILPKSSKLNMLIQDIKEDLKLYAAIVIERRTGLPICASKSLLDDTVLVGDVDRMLLFLDNMIGDFNLAKIQDFKVNTGNGTLDVRIFEQYYILVLLYSNKSDSCSEDFESKIATFIDHMRKNI